MGGHGVFACAIDGQRMRGKGQGDLAFECHALGIQRYQGAGCRAARVFHIATEGGVERVAHQPHLVETPDRTMFFVCIRPVQAKVSVVGLPFRVEMLDFFAALGSPECLAGRLAGKGRGRRERSGKGRGKKGAKMGRPHGCRFPGMAVVLRNTIIRFSAHLRWRAPRTLSSPRPHHPARFLFRGGSGRACVSCRFPVNDPGNSVGIRFFRPDVRSIPCGALSGLVP